MLRKVFCGLWNWDGCVHDEGSDGGDCLVAYFSGGQNVDENTCSSS